MDTIIIPMAARRGPLEPHVHLAGTHRGVPLHAVDPAASESLDGVLVVEGGDVEGFDGLEERVGGHLEEASPVQLMNRKIKK